MQYFQLKKLPIISSDQQEIESLLGRIFMEGRKTKNKTLQLITLNLDNFRLYCKNGEYSKVCRSSDYIFPDGYGIISLLKTRYNKKINRITGHDIFQAILNISEKTFIRMALVGSTDMILATIAEKLTQNYPNIKITCRLAPPENFEFSKELNLKIINELSADKPDVLLAALGVPRQEIWLGNYKEQIGAKINIGVGSVFDVYAGVRKRAPLIIQNLRLEWLWRLSNEPFRLFKRYIISDIPFFIKQSILIKRDEAQS